jgi:polyisoprenoid-binding protein YceI
MTWQLDPTHSSASFGVKHMMVANVRGKFDTFDIEAQIDEQDLSKSQATVTLDVASIDTGLADRDVHIKGADFFDAEQYPELVFTTKRIEPKGEDVTIVGDLTIKGVTKEVRLAGEVSGPVEDPWGKRRIGISAEGKIDRRDWGLEWNVPLGGTGVLVGNQVKLSFDAELVKQN